jgi:hypothetical protein
MIYLVAVFLPPIYFFIKGRWIAGIFSSLVCLFGLVCIATMFGAVVGVPLWMITSVCAVWDLRKRITDENTTMLAKKMAEAMRAETPKSQSE